MTALVPTATIEVLMKYDVHRVTQLWGHIPAQQTDEPHCTKAHFPEMNLASQGQRKTWQGEESCALSIGHITRLLLLGDSSGMRAPTLLPEPQHCLSPATDLQSGLSESLSHPKADASETSQLLTTCKEATENPWEVRCVPMSPAPCPCQRQPCPSAAAEPPQGNTSTFLTWLLGLIFQFIRRETCKENGSDPKQ
ncbi:ras-related protein Rab-11A isoform X4 [Strix aluco]|uniref:ras-related protein Rab-11A isoform X4 n=1 Tax=Strix aluco TaxID=111821 RepID=UPI003DA25E7B